MAGSIRLVGPATPRLIRPVEASDCWASYTICSRDRRFSVKFSLTTEYPPHLRERAAMSFGNMYMLQAYADDLRAQAVATKRGS